MTSALHHIRLELAREPGHPDGDPRGGYDLVAPLDGATHTFRVAQLRVL